MVKRRESRKEEANSSFKHKKIWKDNLIEDKSTLEGGKWQQ